MYKYDASFIIMFLDTYLYFYINSRKIDDWIYVIFIHIYAKHHNGVTLILISD